MEDRPIQTSMTISSDSSDSSDEDSYDGSYMELLDARLPTNLADMDNLSPYNSRDQMLSQAYRQQRQQTYCSSAYGVYLYCGSDEDEHDGDCTDDEGDSSGMFGSYDSCSTFYTEFATTSSHAPWPQLFRSCNATTALSLSTATSSPSYLSSRSYTSPASFVADGLFVATRLPERTSSRDAPTVFHAATIEQHIPFMTSDSTSHFEEQSPASNNFLWLFGSHNDSGSTLETIDNLDAVSHQVSSDSSLEEPNRKLSTISNSETLVSLHQDGPTSNTHNRSCSPTVTPPLVPTNIATIFKSHFTRFSRFLRKRSRQFPGQSTSSNALSAQFVRDVQVLEWEGKGVLESVKILKKIAAGNKKRREQVGATDVIRARMELRNQWTKKKWLKKNDEGWFEKLRLGAV